MYLNVWKITCVDNDPLYIAFQLIDFRIHRFYISRFALKCQLLHIFPRRRNSFSTSQAIYITKTRSGFQPSDIIILQMLTKSSPLPWMKYEHYLSKIISSMPCVEMKDHCFQFIGHSSAITSGLQWTGWCPVQATVVFHHIRPEIQDGVWAISKICHNIYVQEGLNPGSCFTSF